MDKIDKRILSEGGLGMVDKDGNNRNLTEDDIGRYAAMRRLAIRDCHESGFEASHLNIYAAMLDGLRLSGATPDNIAYDAMYFASYLFLREHFSEEK